MKLLVLAQTPPPLHGQSTMVRTLVHGLPGHGIDLVHVNLGLSRSVADIGRWRAGKVLAILDACAHAIAARFSEGCDTLYYVPAPGKRGALYRDWLVMLLCRPFFGRLVLHFHNGGLADWLAATARPLERALTRRLLGGATLAIVLTPSLRADAAALNPQSIAVVPNGVDDPGPSRAAPAGQAPCVLFLGAVTREKGAADLLAALRQLRARGVAATAIFAGPVEPELAQPFAEARASDPGLCETPGFVPPSARAALLDRSTCVCLPSRYPHEAQPLVALEALAADKPLVVSRWRGLPESVPAWVPVVAPGDPRALAEALIQVHRQPPPAGAQRSHFLAHFTIDRHLQGLAAALAGTVAASKAGLGPSSAPNQGAAAR